MLKKGEVYFMKDLPLNHLPRWPWIFLLCLIFYPVPWNKAKASAGCGRVALINYQEVMVDSNVTGKGEGLRLYLEKDPESKRLLDQYQDSIRNQWPHAVMGTTGLLFALGGGLLPKEHPQHKTLLYTGIGLALLNFVMAKARHQQAERYLQRAIEQYNKRNLPRIDLQLSWLNNKGLFGFQENYFSLQLTKDF